MNRPRQAESGFTIIEVLIVLSIAGIILLLTFEAIPALTRSSRNSERKQDISKILQATSSYMLRNSGDFPDTAASPPATPLVKVNLTLYEAGNVTFVANPLALPAPLNYYKPITDPNSVRVVNYAKCLESSLVVGWATDSGADYRNVVALYAVESGSGGVKSLCEEL